MVIFHRCWFVSKTSHQRPGGGEDVVPKIPALKAIKSASHPMECITPYE